eukprot:TRINITY_DN2280_c0_g1_i1.p1 TRINITY_DN2280_c0_g1~~TRINITY_DN2280_c0_g1_i1.p1  ORF type:complete len:154 (+),score=0.42 TRINITY_DN2280_c0_g1_i1:342-803(+)
MISEAPRQNVKVVRSIAYFNIGIAAIFIVLSKGAAPTLQGFIFLILSLDTLYILGAKRHHRRKSVGRYLIILILNVVCSAYTCATTIQSVNQCRDLTESGQYDQCQIFTNAFALFIFVVGVMFQLFFIVITFLVFSRLKQKSKEDDAIDRPSK